MELNPDFILQTFYTYCKRPIHKKYQNVYSAECPVCKEGSSAGRSRRLFYFPDKQYLYCHNCTNSWTPYSWVKEVTGMTNLELMSHTLNNSEFVPPPPPIIPKAPLDDLPDNSVDISDLNQIQYFKALSPDQSQIIDVATECCTQRRLFTAHNRGHKLYVSLDDRVHKNRLVIPFYTQDGNKVDCYQTRALLPDQHPKYLTKYGEKGLFGLEKITPNIPHVFILEGPIDAMFVANGLAIGSTTASEKQRDQLASLIGFERIFVFDNDENNPDVKKRIIKTINCGERVFFWPPECKGIKDVNEFCCKLGIDEFPWQLIVKHSYSGAAAKLKIKLA